MTSGNKLKRKVIEELTRRRFSSQDAPERWPGRSNYVLHAEHALVPGVRFEWIKADFDAADGGELTAGRKIPPKFHAVHSSSALAVNTFGIFRMDPAALRFAGYSGFSSLRFEYLCPTGAGSGKANLDLLMRSKDVVIAIESKFTEFLSGKPAVFSLKYDKVVTRRADRLWSDVYTGLKQSPHRYRHLDAAQLVKHYLGLRGNFPSERLVLAYLFWEPQNAASIDIYRQHAREVAEFQSCVQNSNVEFMPMRYSEVWSALRAVVPRHVTHLENRYALVI